MKSITYLLAFRYLLGSTYEKNISNMALICFFSILIGTFSLALVTAIMRGFEFTIHEKMQGIHAQAIIQSSGDPLNAPLITTIIERDFKDIAYTSPSSSGYALVQSPDAKIEKTPTVVMLKGIDPHRERMVSTIEKKINPAAQLPDIIHGNHVLIGKKLAQSLQIEVGSPLTIFYFDEPSGKRKVGINQVPAVVGGIFDTGIDEFDSGLVMCSLEFIEKIFPHVGITTINLTFAPDANETQTIQALQEHLGLDVYSWKDLYPALVSALKLEKYAMFFILVLITLVASMNIISLLFMLIIQKRPDIAILRAMGMPSSSITHIFVMIGMSIVTIASLLGLTLAWLASWILEHYPFIELPDVYYVSHLPAKMDWFITAAVLIAVLLISLFATWIPARRTRNIVIADVLRFEG